MPTKILVGDCRDLLPDLEPESVDAVVTDPPYGLGFMGKDWDHGLPGEPFWREVIRVMKPGAYLLAFGGTRTYHRLTCAVEDAGFEIRDCLMWMFGSGFPKSLNVGKAMAKARAEDLEPTRAVCREIRAAMDKRGLKSRHLVEYFGGCNPRLIDHWAARDTDSQPTLPTWDQWETLKRALGLSDALDAEVARLNGRKGARGDAWSQAEIVGEHAGEPDGFGEHRFSVRDKGIRALPEEAEKREGWGTALKPAYEPIILARKPLIGTVAKNVEAHGTGALNIDGCRVGGGTRRKIQADYKETKNNAYAGRMDGSLRRGSRSAGETHEGRWPANVIHDGSEEVLAAFPNARGQQGALTGDEPSAKAGAANCYGRMDRRHEARPRIETDKSAARFFYCAKTSRAERNAGLEGFDEKLVHPPSGDGRCWDIPGPQSQPRRNNHPTVKPVALMRYLVRLVTPPRGVVLDPFFGSGSTGIACELEGFDCIGVELIAEYAAIAEARVAHFAAIPVQSELWGAA